LDDFDKAFDELIEKGMIEKVGLGSDKKPEYRLTAKAFKYLDRLKQLDALKQNSPEEILKRTAQPN